MEDDGGEYAGKPFQVQVAYTLAFCARSGRVKSWTPPQELNGIVACKQFEDIQLGEGTEEYELSYGHSCLTAVRSLLPSYKKRSRRHRRVIMDALCMLAPTRSD